MIDPVLIPVIQFLCLDALGTLIVALFAYYLYKKKKEEEMKDG